MPMENAQIKFGIGSDYYSIIKIQATYLSDQFLSSH